MWPHRWQPHRLPRPWDSPGKNTGVGCHFLLQCMKVKSESEVAQSCPTLSDLMNCSLPDSSVHGTFQARVLEWSAIAFSASKGRQNENHNYRKLIKLITALSKSMKLWGMPCRGTQDGRVMMESSDKRGQLEKELINHLIILALRNPWTVWKGKKIGHWKLNFPGW